MNYEDRVTKEYVENALAGFGNCKIATGIYTGTGTYGAEHPNTLTFPFEPKAIFFLSYNHSNTVSRLPIFAIFLSGMDQSTSIESYDDSSSSINGPCCYIIHNVAWAGSSVSWYSKINALAQLNSSNVTYHYVAIG